MPFSLTDLALGALAGAIGIAWALAHLFCVVRRLPEPSISDAKPPYASLVRPLNALCAGALSAIAMSSFSLVAHPMWPLWWVQGSSLLVLVLVDLRTTYLPKVLMWLCAAQLMIALAVCLWISGLPAGAALRALAGSGASGIFYWLIWHFSRGSIGFGDVRLAPALGLVSACHSWTMWWVALFAGSIIGAFWGVGVALWRRKHPSGWGKAFPYGPAMFAGNYCALIWVSLFSG